MDQKLLDLHKKLQSKECFRFLYKKLEQELIWRKTLPKKKKLKEQVLENSIEITGISPYNPLDNFKTHQIFIEDQFSLHARDGIIAGGSVAAWLNEFINQVPAVINDIDYFYYDFKTTESEKAYHISYESLRGEEFDYEIIKVSQEKLLNKIRIHIGKDFTWADLIRSFDLNCTLVAFDPFNRKLIYHREFLEFLSDKVIEPLRTWQGDAPLNTYVRAYKKSFELKASFYMHKHMQIFLNQKNKYWWEKDQYCFKIVHKNYITTEEKKEETIEPEWEASTPIVLICNRGPEKKSIFGFHSNKKSWEELISVKKYDYWKENKKIFEPWISLTNENYAIINKKAFNYPWFHFYQGLEYSAEISSFISYSPTSDVWYSGDREFDDKWSKISPRFYEKSECYYRQLDLLIKSNIYSFKELMLFFNANSNNLQQGLYKEFSTKKFKKFRLFLNEHDLFKRLLFGMLQIRAFNYSLKESIDFFHKISKWKIELIGVMEAALTHLPQLSNHSFTSINEFSSSRYNKRAKEIAGYILRKDLPGLKHFLQECYNEDLDSDLLAKKLPLGSFWEKYVSELNLNSQLHAESDKMRHCVRGYGNSVKSGSSRIFHININGHHSTLELNMIVQNKEDFKKILEKKPHYSLFDHFYNIQQHKSFRNEKPHDLCWKVAHRLVAYLNNYNQYEIIIKNNNERRDRRTRNRQERRRRGEELTRL